jgi:drug/metabolite transporter (DMT)-like permease
MVAGKPDAGNQQHQRNHEQENLGDDPPALKKTIDERHFFPSTKTFAGVRSSIREPIGKPSSIMQERNGSPSGILVEQWLSPAVAEVFSARNIKRSSNGGCRSSKLPLNSAGLPCVAALRDAVTGGITMALSDNSRGALLMSLAMAAFACNDALVKSITAELSIAQIIAVRGLMTTALVFGVGRYLGVDMSWRIVTNRLVIFRVCCELGATLTFFSALKRIEFAAASSIMQSLPLAVTLGAALFLREPVGWRRWAAIAVGFLGVLLIIRPGPEGFAPAALFAVAAVFFTASRDLATRRVSADIPSLSITLFTSLANALLGVILILPMGGWQPVSGSTFGYLALTSLLVFAGYQTVIMAMRSGEISFVAPFRYTSLIWALVISMLVFQEHPNLSMLVGAAVVIGSGLYTFYRESKRQRALAETAGMALEETNSRPSAGANTGHKP